ncbi:MAG: hypothetical protein A2X08_05520 [Bacteroidetes bacterium GWA2_32_17]|nr:MAG: hypothetical protein A2X08_05520 [Bacteroidetes bacterium GWA2_32_17]
MEKILISNIGNRNLHFKDIEISINEFKILTQTYWNDFDSYKKHISLQIIKNHIDGQVEKIYLIVTNQQDEKHNYQDTIFEGMIMQKMILENYNIPVQLIEFNGNPSDENTLFEKLENELKKVFKAHPEHHFIFNDAGGTTQMKQVCKELLAYFVPSERYKIVYSNKSDEKKVIERFFSNKFTLLKTALRFAEHYRYSEALDIVNQIPVQANVPNSIRWWLKVADARKMFNREQLKSFVKLADFPLKEKQIIQQYAQCIIPDACVQFTEFKKKHRADIFEIASLCQLYFKQKEYSIGVLTYYRLVEETVSDFCSSLKYDTDNPNAREKIAEQIYNKYKNKYPLLSPEWGLPLQVVIGLEESKLPLQNLFNLFKKTISFFNTDNNKGINILRNQCYLVHRRQAITEDKINEHCPDFLEQILPDIFKQLDMPKQNIYEKMNHEIKNAFFY